MFKQSHLLQKKGVVHRDFAARSATPGCAAGVPDPFCRTGKPHSTGPAYGKKDGAAMPACPLPPPHAGGR